MTAVAKAEEAVAQDMYDVASIPALEAAVAEQIVANTYSFEANLALLNLYQLEPASSKESVVVQILAKALMALPSSDFSLCLAVVSKEHHASAAVEWLCTLSTHLETGDFKAFWAASNKGGAFDVAAVAGFHDAVRDFVLGLVAATYQKLPLAALGELLQLDGAALDAAITAKGFTKEGTDVAVPLNAENQAKPKGAKETMDFRAVAPVYEMTLGC